MVERREEPGVREVGFYYLLVSLCWRVWLCGTEFLDSGFSGMCEARVGGEVLGVRRVGACRFVESLRDILPSCGQGVVSGL